MDKLNVAEIFYSVQCEGATSGVPSVFIRLKNCNLMCGGSGGSFMKEGKATWWCDTENVWKQGTEYTFDQLDEKIRDICDFQMVLNGTVHLVWTGGEPTLKPNQKPIVNFIKMLKEKYQSDDIFCEIETNGTVLVDEPEFYNFIPGDKRLEGVIDQINCSPKLANSGMPEKIRIKPNAIKQIQSHHNHWFKFVISKDTDLYEIRRDYIEPFNIDPRRIILMPGVDNRAALAERTAFLYEMAKKTGYRAVTRGHILAWDKTTGV